MKRSSPDSEVTELLKKVIMQNKKTWMALPNNTFTLEEARETAIPLENLNRPNALVVSLVDKDNLLDEVCSLLNVTGVTNSIVYPVNTLMKWHTNNDRVGRRTYYTFTLAESIFLYKDVDSGKIIEDLDDVGWTVRSFDIDKSKPLWHSVWSRGVRFSFGFINEESRLSI